jgi:hypothetical protein
MAANNAVEAMQKLLAKIPTIEKKILEFYEQSKKDYAARKKEAITALILSVPSMYFFTFLPSPPPSPPSLLLFFFSCKSITQK